MKVAKKIHIREKEKISKKGNKLSNEKKEKSKPDVQANIPDETVLKAIDAVNKLVQDFQKRKHVLFADDTAFVLQIEAIKIPLCSKRKLRLKLPHWLVTDSTDVCLFVSDLKRGKKVDHEPTVHHYEDLLKEKGITNIRTIMPVRQLRVEYDQIEMRRRLLTQYDIFLADSRISGILAHKLGSIFFNKNALPTPVKMESKDLNAEITKALHKTVIRIHGQGDTFLIKVGVGKQTSKQVCENIQSILCQLSSEFPGGWENIRSVHLKSPQSMSIPIYITLKNKNEVSRPNIKPLRAKNEMVEGEVTTVMGAKLQVYPDGTVKVIKRKNETDDESEEESPTIKNKKAKNENSKNQPVEKVENDIKELIKTEEADSSDDKLDDADDSEDENIEDVEGEDDTEDDDINDDSDDGDINDDSDDGDINDDSDDDEETDEDDESDD